MSIVNGQCAKTKKDYQELASYFLKDDPRLIDLWKRNAKGGSEHSVRLYQAGKAFLAAQK